MDKALGDAVVVVFLVFVGIPVVLMTCLVIWFFWNRSRNSVEQRQRGFEVKLNTGEEPVTEKKENEHG